MTVLRFATLCNVMLYFIWCTIQCTIDFVKSILCYGVKRNRANITFTLTDKPTRKREQATEWRKKTTLEQIKSRTGKKLNQIAKVRKAQQKASVATHQIRFASSREVKEKRREREQMRAMKRRALEQTNLPFNFLQTSSSKRRKCAQWTILCAAAVVVAVVVILLLFFFNLPQFDSLNELHSMLCTNTGTHTRTQKLQHKHEYVCTFYHWLHKSVSKWVVYLRATPERYELWFFIHSTRDSNYVFWFFFAPCKSVCVCVCISCHALLSMPCMS